MADEKGKRLKEQRYSEPDSIDVRETGIHPAGNYLGPESRAEGNLPPLESVELFYEMKDHAKQGRMKPFRVDPKDAKASPNHPHFGHVRGSGELQ